MPGVPLTLSKSGVVDLSLQWGASCLGSDTDYAVYEGALGDFTSHAALFCSTGGQTSVAFEDVSSASYYLVAPSNEMREGSLGTDSAGAPRPAGVVACADRLVSACP